MKIGFSPEVKKELLKIKKKDPALSRKIQKQLQLFTTNSTHPSLRLHKLSGNLKEFRSISITKSLRMVYQVKETSTAYSKKSFAYFVDLGTHDEVYKK